VPSSSYFVLFSELMTHHQTDNACAAASLARGMTGCERNCRTAFS
jgi:hypothetical protein